MKKKTTEIPPKQKNSIIAERFKYLINKHGRLTARFVVDDARDPKSPIHDQFDWNDATAADKQRLAHARRLISEVQTVITRTHFTFATVGYVRNPRIPPSEQGYVSTEELCKPANKKLAREAIDLEIKQVLARMERLRDLAAALGQQAVVDAMIAELTKFSEQIAA